MQVDSESRKYKGMKSGYVSYKLSIFWKDKSVCVKGVVIHKTPTRLDCTIRHSYLNHGAVMLSCDEHCSMNKKTKNKWHRKAYILT